MSALRICVIAAVMVAAAVLADEAWTYAGCPASPVNFMFFGNATVTCSKAQDCQSAYCSCINATVGANWTCGHPTTAPNCTMATACVALKNKCLNSAADDATCTALKELKMSNLAVAGGQLYNASVAYKACKAESCMALNMTAGNCSLEYDTLCASPINFVGTLRLSGDFTQIFASPTAKAAFQAALEKDLAKALGVAVRIIRMFIATKSRRQATQVLVIEFEAAGVSAQNTDLISRLGGLTDNSWMVAALTEYRAVYGASATFGFVGIAAGSSSSAIFSASGSASVTTTTTGSSASVSGSSGASAQSLVAAVVVAVIGAMMF